MEKRNLPILIRAEKHELEIWRHVFGRPIETKLLAHPLWAVVILPGRALEMGE
jgi:hypothetical protein